MITLSATSLALAPGIQSSFSASGGTSPYIYSVRAGGVGGTINSSTGWYTAPQAYGIDTVVVTDSTGAYQTSQIQSSPVIELLRDIIVTEMGLAQDRAYIYNQKWFQPTDEAMYIAIGIQSCKPYGFTNTFVGASQQSSQAVNMQGTFWIECMSRGTDALYNKEQIVLALSSDYSKNQQSLNQFWLAPLTTQFTDLSQIDGAAIPYRYHLVVNALYLATKLQSTDYFDTFQTTTVTTEA